MYNIQNNQYYIEDIPVLGLAKKYGTPLYIYSRQTILDRINDLKQNLAVYPNTRFLYAVKANYNPAILRTIISEGIGVDTVSIDEVKLALHCGAKPENIMYTESMISDAEMREAHDLGILLNIGSLSRLEKWGAAYPGSEVCVRFNPNVGAGSHTGNITAGPDVKFGIPHEQANEVLQIAQKHNLHIVGIHEHIGSGWLDYNEALLAMDIIFEVARLIAQHADLRFIDLGGGFGVPYLPTETRLDLAALGREYARKFTAFNEEYQQIRNSADQNHTTQNPTPLQLRFEPGRYLVAESGHLLAEVTTLKNSPNGKIFAGLNTGFNQLIRVAMYGSYHPITNLNAPPQQSQNSPPQNQQNATTASPIPSNDTLIPYEICGNVCESTDIFASARPLPKLHEGDILSLDIAGAYGISMASNYQFRSLPAEILISGNTDTLIRRRQTADDLINQFPNHS